MPQTFPLLPIALGSALLLTACRPTPSTPLTSAAFRGDAVEVTTLLKTTSADTAADGWSPLIWAARAGRVEVMTLLLDAGADPNRRDTRQGWTPLMHAQHARQRSAAQLLLRRGADGAGGAGGTSPMEMAVLDNDVALLRTLLAANPPRDQQVRAFALAVSGGALADVDRPLLGRCHSEAVSLLLSFDKTLAQAQHEGVGTPLWWARRQGCQATISQLAAARATNLAQKTH
jgi:ankyrin repeat protein